MKLLVILLPLLALSMSAKAETIAYDAIGCADVEDFKKAQRFALAGDKEAWIQFLTIRVASGECAMLDRGDEVSLEDFGLFSGVACVRPRGHTVCYNVEAEAVD